MKTAIFGAGIGGCAAAVSCFAENREIECFVDNDVNKQGERVLGIPVISLAEYKMHYDMHFELLVACNRNILAEIIKQLQQEGISEYSILDLGQFDIPHGKNRLLSYAQPGQLEDVILYHALLLEKDIFYIDIGSNDPCRDSVTKLLYDMRNANGIDIEPLQELCELTKSERPRDICLNCGIGEISSSLILNVSGEGSTFRDVNHSGEKRKVEMKTLADVCKNYLHQRQTISFLKIDVEGFEEQVLRGADFNHYRPLIMEIESVHPETRNASYDQWEAYVFSQKYHFVYAWGVNRYYVADERADLDQRFISVEKLARIYQIHFMGNEI